MYIYHRFGRTVFNNVLTAIGKISSSTEKRMLLMYKNKIKIIRYLFPVIGLFIAGYDFFSGIFKKSRSLIVSGLIGTIISLIVIFISLFLTTNSNSAKQLQVPYTMQRLQKTDSLLELYKLKYGTLPDSLDQLKFFGIIVIFEINDPFKIQMLKHYKRQTFEYKKLDRNNFILISVGKDGDINTPDDIIYKGGGDSIR